MKLVVPVAGMVVAAGSCCCCGLDPTELFEEFQREMGASSDITFEEGGDDALADGTADDAPSAAIGGGSTEGVCGRFKDDGLTVPSGLKVLACGNFGGSESITMMGSGDPETVCGPLKSWATGNGWSVQHDVTSEGNVAVVLKNADKQMTLACADGAGQTTVSISVR